MSHDHKPVPLFSIEDGRPIAEMPGEPGEEDGRERFTIEQTAQRVNRSAEHLRETWHNAIGRLIGFPAPEAAAPTDAEPKPVPPEADPPRPARRRPITEEGGDVISWPHDIYQIMSAAAVSVDLMNKVLDMDGEHCDGPNGESELVDVANTYRLQALALWTIAGRRLTAY